MITPPDRRPDPAALADAARAITQTVYGTDVSDDEFYTRALHVLSGPRRRGAVIMRVLNGAYYLALIVALGWLCGQVMDRDPPNRFITLRAVDPQVRAGDPVRVRFDIERRRLCHAAISWVVIDAATEIHHFGPRETQPAGPLGHDSLIIAYDTTPVMALGPAILRIVAAYDCPGNYVQNIEPITVELPDVRFDVVAREAYRHDMSAPP